MARHGVGRQRTATAGSIRRSLHVFGRARPIARPGRAETMFDEFGQRLNLFASVLTDDPELVDRLVIQSIVAHESEASSLQELSAGVYVAWIAWGSPPLSNHGYLSADASPATLLINEIRDLAADQRAALGLCKYGGHTYTRAAEVLGLAPDHVATLLGEALRSLGDPRASRALTAVGA